jgi:hypothetical protein
MLSLSVGWSVLLSAYTILHVRLGLVIFFLFRGYDDYE